jgi:hypothetical protein
VRARPLIRVPNDVGPQAAIAMVEGLGVHSGFGDDWLRIWGLKLVLDGGVEGRHGRAVRQRPGQQRASQLGS